MTSKIIDLTNTNLILSSIQEDLSKSSETLVQLQAYLTTPEPWYIKFAPAFIGLGGVLLGALITYGFNHLAFKRDSKARFAIQRKNLIFSKLYKELVKFSEQMRKLPSGTFYCEFITANFDDNNWKDDFYFDGGYHEKPVFLLFDDMSKDIRITQIPVKIQNELTTFQDIINDYQKTKSIFTGQIKSIEKKHNLGLNIEKAFYFNSDNKEIPESLFKDHSGLEEEDPERVSKVQKEVLEVLKTNVLQNMRGKFTTLNNSLKKTTKVLKEEIDYIVSKYEYGESL